MAQIKRISVEKEKGSNVIKRNDLKPLNILIAASEAVPFIKTGGMGDVCGALSKALKRQGHDVRLVLPRYWDINPEKWGMKTLLAPMGVQMGDRTVWCSVLETSSDGVPVYFIEHENYFGRSGLYDDGKREYLDNAERFGFFSKACLQLAKDIGFKPDIVHANDWQTALLPAYLKIWYKDDPFFRLTASIFTIHNIGYQGAFHKSHYDFLGLGKENFTESKFESWGGVHFMKGGIYYADAVSTVSPSYAEEILTPDGGSGLAPYLERRKDDLAGILNGADYDHWDPRTDPLIPANYSSDDLSGKSICKRELQREFVLREDPNVPVVGIVSRLVHQKGFDLVAPIIRSVAKDMMIQFVILGAGEKRLEDLFGGLPAEFPGIIGAWIGYSNEKAHRIEAGSDFFLMPSLYEPCGLNQMYSMRYGTLPIVREIGGLKDTVRQYNEKSGTGTGFRFLAADPMAVYYTIGWAVSTYYDRPRHISSMKHEAMEQEFSWSDSAHKYVDLYKRAIARRATWR